jgi:8-oxo-dGTP pyrophosphatase MutT (NUDIX family)
MQTGQETQTQGQGPGHQAPVYCNHTSVGVIVERGDTYLFFKRVKFPPGYAAPAGHVDELPYLNHPNEAGIYEEAAGRELEEEVGLLARRLTLVLEATTLYPCRRIPLDAGEAAPARVAANEHWHRWRVYRAEIDEAQASRGNETETRDLQWLTREQLQAKAARTALYLQGRITEQEWRAEPGLEPVWKDFFEQLHILTRPTGNNNRSETTDEHS